MMTGVAARPSHARSDPDAIADAVIAASGVLLQVLVRALEAFAPNVNLTEFRTLTLLEQQGPQRLIDIAGALEVTSTTATRLADHLAEQGLVDRIRQSSDRREIHIAIAAPGRSLVQSVSLQRRRFVTSVLDDSNERDQAAALRLLARLGHPAPVAETESA